MVVSVLAGLRHWHTEQSLLLRSPAECIAWYSDQALGGYMPSLLACFSPLVTAATLEYCGFAMALSPGMAALPVDSPVLGEEDQWATTLARFALEAVANRVRCLLWHEEGFPGAWPPS